MITVGIGYAIDHFLPSLYVAGGVIISDLWGSPDLDCEFSNCKRRWWYLGAIWKPYHDLAHRHYLSHMPVLSDAVRILYLMIPVTTALALFFFAIALADSPQSAARWIDALSNTVLTPNATKYGAFVFAGLSLSTALHSSADAIVSEAKKVID